MPRRNEQVAETPSETEQPTATPMVNVAQQFIDTVIDNTKVKMVEKAAAVAVVAEARTMLHSFITQGLATEDQTKWILENLPRKVRADKSDDEDATVPETNGDGAAPTVAAGISE